MKESLCELRKSPIAGDGIFSLCPIAKGTVLFETHIKDAPDWNSSWINLTPNCLYNHSKDGANCVSQTNGKWKVLIAVRDIQDGEELLVDYTKDPDLEQPQEDWI